jgi:hypothetical protein
MIMISCLSKMDILFGIGNQFEENTFEFNKDLTIHFYDEMEMNNINNKLKTIKLDYVIEKNNVGINKERNRIYGIYKII